MTTRHLLTILLVLGLFAAPHVDAALDFKEWGLLAAQNDGRRKPMDTLARETLMRLTGRREVTAFSKTWMPSDFMLSMLLETEDWRKEPIILVDFRPLVVKLGFDPAEKRFSYMDLARAPVLGTMLQEAQDIRDAGDKPDRIHQEVENVVGRLALFDRVEKGEIFLLVPAPKDLKQAWAAPPDFATYYSPDQFATATKALQSVAAAYRASNSLQFTSQAHELRSALRALSPAIYPSEGELGREYFYNQLHPFNWAARCYALALLLLGAGAWFGVRNPCLGRLGLVATLGGLLFHVTGMGLRCWIGGRQ